MIEMRGGEHHLCVPHPGGVAATRAGRPQRQRDMPVALRRTSVRPAAAELHQMRQGGTDFSVQ
jgi:hypothetical protein